MKALLVLLMFLPLVLFSQWNDDFSDGDFLSNPSWLGDVDSFEVLNGMLHLNAPANTSESYLAVPSSGAVGGSWEFSIRLDFNPSSSNKLMVYLCSDSANLKSTTQGYFVMIGNTSDEISLYKKKGTQEIELIDGEDAWTNSSSVALKLKVERDALGNFELFADSSAAQNTYQSMGQAFDNEFLYSSYFGILCDYTATRSDKFWLDNFSVSSTEYVDSYPPQLDSFYLVNLNQLALFFDENLDSLFAQNPIHYSLDGLNPSLVECNQNELLLHFPLQFGTGIQSLNFTVTDFYQNALDTTLQFTIEDNYPYGSILFSEIYADESPSFGMPNYEFLELYNSSTDSIYLENWKLADSGDTINLPAFGLVSGAYIILCKTTAESEYSTFGRAKGIPNFPSLNNAGDALVLFNAYGNIVDSLSYKSSWYRNLEDTNGNQKKDGGYSFERRLEADLCSNFYHWYPAIAALGASPGTSNSIEGFAFPQSTVQVDSFFLEMDTTLVIYFREEIPFIQQSNISVYYSTENGTTYNPVEQAFNLPSTNEMYLLVQSLFYTIARV
ncbi:MAG: lamin tail domain-containing protein [Chitinophagales bacterium]